jgi:hypothetical protein
VSFVPHQERHALHGITVVVDTNDGVTYIGRLDTADERTIALKDVAVHEGAGVPRAEFLQATLRYGVRRDRPQMLVDAGRVVAIEPLNSISPSDA